MSIRRLNSPPVVVLTGVENSGKTALAEALVKSLGWAHLPEAARTDPKVIQGRVNKGDLARLLDAQTKALSALKTENVQGIICDTGPLVLDRWCASVFGCSLEKASDAQQDVDLYLLCHTLPDWEADPLRSLPDFDDRLAHQKGYADQLKSNDLPWQEVPVHPLPERLEFALDLIARHCPRP